VYFTILQLKQANSSRLGGSVDFDKHSDSVDDICRSEEIEHHKQLQSFV